MTYSTEQNGVNCAECKFALLKGKTLMCCHGISVVAAAYAREDEERCGPYGDYFEMPGVSAYEDMD